MLNSKRVFTIHFLVVTLSHLFFPVILAGGWFILLDAKFNIWIKGGLMGVLFYTAILGINHIFTETSRCCLTALEMIGF